MSISKKSCSVEDIEKRNSETINEKEEMQTYEKKILQCVLAERIDSTDLQKLPFIPLLKPEFIPQIHMVMLYYCWNYRAIIVTKDKNVYSVDCNKDDHSKAVDVWIHTALCLKKIKELCGKNIKTIAQSSYFILALTEEGEVYFWEFDKCESNDTSPVASTPTRIFDLGKKLVVDIACGSHHFLALTSDGKVYAWGKNNYGQVGNENTAVFISVPWQVRDNLKNNNVVRIACGSTFNVVITDENIIYGWGNNEKGQISMNLLHKYYIFPWEIITIFDRIVKVACGYDHTLVLTNKGEIYAWGNNEFGQVGVNNKIERCGAIMVNVPEMGKVLDIAAYKNFSVAVGYDRTIYVWGKFNCNYSITTPFPTKFSKIYDVFACNKYKYMNKLLTVFPNNYKYVDEVLNILKSLGAAFDDPLTSDFTIQVKGQPIYVHKAILKIRCLYFKNMIQHGWTENIQSISNSSSVYIAPDKFSYIIYKAFLKYLYTGTIDLPLENTLELMELADMYCEINLKKDCSQIIKQAITISNVAFFHNKAIECNAKELEEFCFEFAQRHMTADTLSEIIKLDTNTQPKFIQRSATQSHVAIMSMSKKFCSPADVEKRNSETINKKIKMLKYEKRILRCILAEKLIDLKIWPVFQLLKQEFIPLIHMIMVYGIYDTRAIILTNDKNVYSLDYNDDYSKIDDIHTATYLRKVKELCGKNIKTFAGNDNFILVLTKEGEVYFSEFENCDDEELDISEVPTFTRVVDLIAKHIIDIACGEYHCLALSSDGKVYAWGKNDHGQIGDGNVTTLNSAPKQVKHELENKNVIRIACGSSFNMVITDENKLYGWGSNENGQIPILQSQKHHVYPREITRISDQIVKVACGQKHTLALTNKGEIYAWGDNYFGQVGVNNKIKRCGPIMVNVPKMGKVLDIAAFEDLSVAVGYDKIIYVWGHFYYYCFTPIPTKFSRIYEAFFARYGVMQNPLIVSTNDYMYVEVFNILESLRAIFDDPLTNDFTVQVEGRRIYVHKAILKIRCQYFKNMFQHDWAENFQSTSDSSSVFIVSDKFSYIVYKAFLKYLYTGTIDLPSEYALELMELANMYCETNLIKDCSQIIKKVITVSNVAFFYNEAIKCNAKELEEFCFQFALRHVTEVTLTEDYIKLDVNTKDNFMRRAAKENAFRT